MIALFFSLFVADGPASLPVGEWRVTRFTFAPELGSTFTPPLASEVIPKGDLVLRVLADDDARLIARRYISPTGQTFDETDRVQLKYGRASLTMQFSDEIGWVWPLNATRRLRRIDDDHFAIEGRYLGETRNMHIPGVVTYLERYTCPWCATFERDQQRERTSALATASLGSEQQCKKKDWLACEDLAMDFYHGSRGRQVDKKKALELFTRACQGGLANDCLNAARMHDDAKRYKLALPLFQRACASADDKDGEGCHRVGLYYVEGFGVKKDYKRALAADLKACDRNHAISCSNAAEIYRDHHQNEKRAKELFARGCELGDDYSCQRK